MSFLNLKNVKYIFSNIGLSFIPIPSFLSPTAVHSSIYAIYWAKKTCRRV